MIRTHDTRTGDTVASRAYIDTNVFIYFLEFEGELNRAATAKIADFQKNGTQVITSRLTFLECIYGPSKAGATALVDMYRSMLTHGAAVHLVEMTNDILESAALNGGNLGLKLADAIHYFTALRSGCDLFLTNDRRFKSTPSMRVDCLINER